MKKRIFNKKTNDTVFICWMIFAMIIFAMYTVRYFNNLISLVCLVSCFIIGFCPITIIFLFNKFKSVVDLKTKYYVALSYILFYTFIMVTIKDNISFVYIIPMIATLVVYNDKMLIGMMSFYAVFINFVYIIISYLYGYSDLGYLNIYFAEVISIFLSGIFLYRATELLKMHNDKLYELGEIIVKDPLTDAYNRKFLSDNFSEFIDSSKKNGLSFAILDIDDFKNFNTKYGHDFGDVVLKTLSAIIIKILNKYEDMYFIRLGGDEFAIIAVDVNYDRFARLLDNIRKIIEGYKLKCNDEEVGICISLGATNSKKSRCVRFETIYKHADKNLYKAKEQGKNTVVK